MHPVHRFAALAVAKLALLSAAIAAVPVVNTSTWPGLLPGDWKYRTQTPLLGYDFRYQVVATNSPATFGADGLPPGLNLDTATGVITGQPTTTGSFPITLSATNADGVGQATVTLAVQSAPTAAPVMQPLADRDTVLLDANQSPILNPGDYVENGTLSHEVRMAVTASNYPTAITATNLPPARPGLTGGGAAVGPANQGYIGYNPDALLPGRYGVTVVASNAVGSSDPVAFTWTVHPALLGELTVENNHTFVAGETITVIANFTGPVVVTGTPYVSLHNGARAYYASDSGTNLLRFKYTIGSGDGSYTADLPTGIELNGGTIGTADGISAKVQDSPTHTSRPGEYSVNAATTYVQPSMVDNIIPGALGIVDTWTFSGKSAPGSTVRLSLGANPMGAAPADLGSAVADSNGIWLMTVPLREEVGTYTFDATAAGIPSNGPRNFTVRTDVPVVADVSIVGTVGTPLSPVQLQIANAGNLYGIAVLHLSEYGLAVDGYGRVSGTPSKAADHVALNVTATNDAGTSARATMTLSLSSSSAADTPVITAVTAARSPTFSGTAQPGARIEITTADRLVRHLPPATADVNGRWTISTAPYAFANGTYSFVANTTTASGAFLRTSAPVSVTINEPASSGPHVTLDQIIPPAMGSGGGWQFRGSAPAGSTVDLELIDNVGETLPGTLGIVTADANGGWSVSHGIETAVGNYVFAASARADGGAPISGTGYVVYSVTANPPPPSEAPTGVPVVAQQADIELEYHFYRHDEFMYTRITASNAPTRFDVTGPHPGSFNTVGSGTQSAYGEFVWTYGSLSGGKFTNSVTATNSIGTSAPMTFTWIIHPGMNDFIQPSARTFTTGDVITLTTTFSAPVYVTGTPYIPLWGTKKAMYIGGSGTTKLQFAYQVAADDPAQAGLYYADIAVGDGSIATADGVSASLHDTFTGVTAIPTFSVTQGQIPPTSSKADQTITFSSPVSAVMIGQPIQLGATSSAGLPITYSVVSGDATLSGTTLTPTSTATLIVRASSAGNETVNAASVDVSFGNPQKTAQVINVSTNAGRVAAEMPVALAATTTSGLPITYTVVSGPATVSGSTLTFTGTGAVVVRASQAGDGTCAAANDVTLSFTVTPVNRLVNLSARAHVAAGDASRGAIAGFVVTGSAPKPILVRAVGPSLAAFGVTAPLPTPQLQVFDSHGAVLAGNRGWSNDAQIAAAGDGVGAFKLANGSKDAAILVTLAPGAYTAQVQSDDGGTVLVEVYDVAANAAVPTKQLINLSTRGSVGSGDDVIVGGFVVSGASAKRVLIRAVGPGLAGYGVAGVLADPMLTLYDAKGAVLARNDNWETAQGGDALTFTTTAADVSAANTAAGAFTLASGSKDAALVLTLEPGATPPWSAAPTAAPEPRSSRCTSCRD